MASNYPKLFNLDHLNVEGAAIQTNNQETKDAEEKSEKKIHIHDETPKEFPKFFRLFAPGDITPMNACEEYHFARESNNWEVIKKCLELFSEKTKEVVESEGFRNAVHNTVKAIVRCPKLSLKTEAELFRAVMRWAKAHLCRQKYPVTPHELRRVLQPLLPYIRFLDMTAEEFALFVVPEGILTLEEEHRLLVNTAVGDGQRSTSDFPQHLSTDRSCRMALPSAEVSVATPDTVVSYPLGAKGHRVSLTFTVHDEVPDYELTMKLQVLQGVVWIEKVHLNIGESDGPIVGCPVHVTVSLYNTSTGCSRSATYVEPVQSQPPSCWTVNCRSVKVLAGSVVTVALRTVAPLPVTYDRYQSLALPVNMEMGATEVRVLENWPPDNRLKIIKVGLIYF